MKRWKAGVLAAVIAAGGVAGVVGVALGFGWLFSRAPEIVAVVTLAGVFGMLGYCAYRALRKGARGVERGDERAGV